MHLNKRVARCTTIRQQSSAIMDATFAPMLNSWMSLCDSPESVSQLVEEIYFPQRRMETCAVKFESTVYKGRAFGDIP